MSYKTIMVHVDHTQSAARRTKIAIDLALRENAHLIGIGATGISSFIYSAGEEVASGPAFIEHFNLLRERTEAALASFISAAQEAGVSSYEKRLIEDEASGGISLHGRYSDLIVLGQTDLEQPGASVMPDFPEYVVIHSGRPVLVVPYTWRQADIGKEVLIAWDASIGASRALTNALPFLRNARNVRVAIFNPQAQGNTQGELPGNDIALYLARHGLKVEVLRRTARDDIGNALLTLAAETASDTIVMGGYGHSRFREILLGGVTRTVLDAMTVPVLMSH